MVETKRIPADERRAMLVRAGIEIARAESGRAVTLTRVAEATGVTKPIAYRLFTGLPDLLAQMRQAIDADYEALIADALRRAAAAGAPQAGLLGVLARTYIEHSLGDGAVYDTVTAALAAAAPADDRPLALSDSQLALARDLFAQSAERGPVAIVMFLGAADALVDAVRDGLVEREDAIAHLVDLFLPLLPDGDAT